MSYGLYLSAAGVVGNSHRQDVIANNLANVETAGFKRSMAMFQQRPAESKTPGQQRFSHPLLDGIGGGLFISPTRLDLQQGNLEPTDNRLDVAIQGEGYFAVRGRDGDHRLTRDGRMLIDNQGFVIAGDDTQARLLGPNREPIRLQGFSPAELRIDTAGRVLRAGTSEVLATIGVFKPVDANAVLLPVGNSQMQIWADNTAIQPIEGIVRSGFVERSNVDPATEMVRLIEAQRQLEANANMIRYQDQATGRLVAEVGKIG